MLSHSATSGPGTLPAPFTAGAALLLLLGKFRRAELLERSVWDFSCSGPQLRELGASETLLQTLLELDLICRVVRPSALFEPDREGEPLSSGWSTHCSFVLTPRGAALAGDLEGGKLRRSPIWDVVRRELRYQGLLVKRFQRAALNQECILSALEELGWPRRIDNPLPRDSVVDPEQRLHDTVKNLNRGHRHHVLQFRMEADGRGVRWASLAGTD